MKKLCTLFAPANPKQPQLTMNSESLIQFNNVSYKSKGRQILEEINLELFRGEIVTVLGPNGAGKSTIAKMAIGLTKPSSGSISREKALKIGYMPQKISFDSTLPMTARYFLSLLPTHPTEEQIEDSLTEVGVNYLTNHSIHQLSGGELQRVLLARALLHEPDLLILDEPAQGVDIIGQQELYSLIAKINQQRECGILLISHDLHIVLASTTRVICVNRHICCSGHPDAVSQDPAYLKLFGKEGSSHLAVYAHNHDHTHHLPGDNCDLSHNSSSPSPKPTQTVERK